MVSFSDQMKQKADEVNLQAKAKELGDAVGDMVKAALDAVAGYASQHREQIDGALDKAEQTIADQTGGKHADTVTKVRSKVDHGIDKLAQKGDSPAASTVPDDQYSAFDEDSPTGHS